MEKFYTSEKNTQILIYLMKKHGIKKVVVSPGATNVCFVGSIQQDSYFELFSCVDERSAAYMACGLSAESGEAVALSCTGATASRNYMPGLTEAYYRQLPILAITSTQHTGKVGNYVPQVIDRSVQPKDVVKFSADIPTINSVDDEWACNVKLNKALMELRHNGAGPVHINLATSYNPDFSVKKLPEFRVINRITKNESMPVISSELRVGIFVGTHPAWNKELTEYVDRFCEKYNGIVFCDRVANYYGKYRVNPCIVGGQLQYSSSLLNCDILIHIGSVSGTDNHMGIKPKWVWRVNPDGEIRDTFRKLQYVFEMEEIDFFKIFAEGERTIIKEYYDSWVLENQKVHEKLPELPFSNAWIAHHTLDILPENSTIHFAILNSLRSWSYFESQVNPIGFSNTGGFGIDGCVSSLTGASLINPEKIYFGVIGDLAFFYDMNSLGNRDIGNNVRLLIVNNGRGQEFRNSVHHAARFGEDADQFMTAAGHFGNKSVDLIRHYAEDLGYKYLCASNKEEYMANVEEFVSKNVGERPIVFEVFTDTIDESEAFDIIHNIEKSPKESAKKIAKDMLGDRGVKVLKSILKH